MPFVQVNVPTGATDDAKKADVVTRVTKALTDSMGVPAAVVHVHINEVAQNGYATGGEVLA